jgi:phage pi2 protein 07
MEEIQDWEKWIETKINEWEKDNLTDKDLWEQFQDDFDEWTEKDFNSDVSNTLLRRLRNILRRRGVWVSRDEKITIEKALYNTLQEKTPIKWTEKEVLRYLSYENFIFISIKILLKTNFGRKPSSPVPSHSVSSPPSSERQSTSSRFSKPVPLRSFSSPSSERQSIPPRFSKFFQSSKFSSVFNRQLYSRLPLIPSYRQSLISSENQSTGRQSALIIDYSEHVPTTEISEHPDDEPSAESTDKSSVGPSDGLLIESSDEPSVNPSFKLPPTENQG